VEAEDDRLVVDHRVKKMIAGFFVTFGKIGGLDEFG
jgi:hypothetical protein